MGIFDHLLFICYTRFCFLPSASFARDSAQAYICNGSDSQYFDCFFILHIILALSIHY